MSKESPEHQLKAISEVLKLLNEALPEMFELTPEGVIFNGPKNLSPEDIFLLAEKNKPGVTKETEIILEAGKHPEQ